MQKRNPNLGLSRRQHRRQCTTCFQLSCLMALHVYYSSTSVGLSIVLSVVWSFVSSPCPHQMLTPTPECSGPAAVRLWLFPIDECHIRCSLVNAGSDTRTYRFSVLLLRRCQRRHRTRLAGASTSCTIIKKAGLLAATPGASLASPSQPATAKRTSTLPPEVTSTSEATAMK